VEEDDGVHNGIEMIVTAEDDMIEIIVRIDNVGTTEDLTDTKEDSTIDSKSEGETEVATVLPTEGGTNGKRGEDRLHPIDQGSPLHCRFSNHHHRQELNDQGNPLHMRLSGIATTAGERDRGVPPCPSRKWWRALGCPPIGGSQESTSCKKMIGEVQK